MLVLDLTDNFLDQVFDRDQAVDPAEFVDHHRNMGSCLAHLDEEVEDRRRRRDEQHLAQQRRQLGLAVLGDRAEHILDVHEADHIIEGLAIHRNPRMTLLDHAFDDFGERRLGVERHDIDARHHHVGSRLVVDLEDIANQQPLVAAQRVSIVGSRLLDHLVDGFAQALAVARAADQTQKVAQTGKGPIVPGLGATTWGLRGAHG